MDQLRTALQGKKTYFAVGIGLLYLLGVWAELWPYNEVVLGALGLSGLGFLRAGLQRNTSLLLIGCLALPILVGCARFTTTQKDLLYEEGLPRQAKTTRASAYTLFSARSSLATWKATQTDASQGATVGGLEQSSTTTNLATNADALIRLITALRGY